MIPRTSRYLLLFSILLLLAVAGGVTASAAETMQLRLGQGIVALNGPWKFHLGDDPRWSAVGLDDSGWESVDLTPPPGAHDDDVGLPNFVRGWSARGHAGYAGFAWYRLRLTATVTDAGQLALTGPTAVESAYQLFVDGRLLGQSADFGSLPPAVFGIKPRLFPLADRATAGNTREMEVALRVWMGPWDAADPNGGGIRVAPQLGYSAAADAAVQQQWVISIRGYLVDAIEPAAFMLLALMAGGLIVADPGRFRYPWLAIALVLTALLRVNQVVFFWFDVERLELYDIARNVVLTPLVLASWIMAWRGWFAADRARSVPILTAAMLCVYMGSQLLGRSWFLPTTAHAVQLSAHAASTWLRLVDLALFGWTVVIGVRYSREAGMLTALGALLTAVGLFAEELSRVGVPGIWFPYGTGVSRTQFAFAGLIAVVFALILGRLIHLARAARVPAPMWR